MRLICKNRNRVGFISTFLTLCTMFVVRTKAKIRNGAKRTENTCY